MKMKSAISYGPESHSNKPETAFSGSPADDHSAF
jgi:hypothetical protein